MNRRLIRMACAITVSACLTLTDCSFSKEEAVEPKPVRIELTQDILSFDPMLTSDIFSEAVLRCVYTSLYDFNDELELRPKLVKTSTVIDDCTWRIEIHDNVKFQNGSRLTTDDTTFIIRTKEPYADFLSIFAKAETSIVSKAVVESPGYDFSKPVGAGPFKLVAREENS